MMHLNSKTLTLIVLLLLVACKSKEDNCNTIHNGSFYFYPSFLSKGNFTIIRSDSTQQEIDHITGDTSLWNVEWLDNCDYKLRYKRGIKKFSEAEAQTAQQQIVYVRILDVNKDYYRIKINGGILPKEGKLDTIWRKLR